MRGSSERTSNRVVYFDYLRVVAICAVIVLHVAAQNWGSIDINTASWQFFNIADNAVRWGVPIFVMISGALFLNKKYDFKKLYTKNILRIIVALLFWSIIYGLWRLMVVHEVDSFEEMVFGIVSNPAHLWFLYMLLGLYIIVPILYKIAQDKKIAWYFVVLAFIFSFFIPEIIEILRLSHHTWADFLYKTVDALKINLVLGYSGYFVLGYLLNKTPIQANVRKRFYILAMLGLIFTILGTMLVSNYLGSPTVIIYQNLTVNVFLMSVGVFVFFKTRFNFVSRKREKCLLALSKYSFGVYLVHLLVLDSLNVFFGLNTLSFNVALSVPIIAIIVISVSFVFSLVLNKIPIINKWIV